MPDKREKILIQEHRKFVEAKEDSLIYPKVYKEAAINAMDAYMKECVTEAFEYVVKNTTGHSIESDGSVSFKFKGEWISKEQLFENFL
jgi:hypothetical protein